VADAQIAAGHYEPDGYGDARKFLVNLYTEPNGGDPARPVRLVDTPGSRLIDGGSVLSTGVRGLFQADGYAGGKLVVPDGTTVRLYNVATDAWTSLTGTLTGTDRVRVAFGETQAGFLSGGLFYVSASAGTDVAAATDADWATLLSDHGETAFTSIATMGQRALLTYGSRFAFSTTLQFNTTTTLSYYTAENAPDGIIAGVVLGDIYYVFGTQTIEPWLQTGDNDNPFSPIVGQVVTRGAMARDAIVKLDNTLFFIGDDRAVYRLNGLVPQMINANDAWITRYLQTVNASDVVCSSMETEAHKFLFIWTPDKCIAYDVATSTWQIRRTYGSDTWEWLHHVANDGKFYAANQATALVELSRSYKSDRQADASTFGTHIVREFTAHLPVKTGRPPVGQVRVEGTKGIGLSTGTGSNPLLELSISRDQGNTFEAWRSRSLGVIGNYGARTSWEQNGLAGPEQTVLYFRWSDPVGFLPSRVAIGER
jgi:hypothetical protein